MYIVQVQNRYITLQLNLHFGTTTDCGRQEPQATLRQRRRVLPWTESEYFFAIVANDQEEGAELHVLTWLS